MVDIIYFENEKQFRTIPYGTVATHEEIYEFYKRYNREFAMTPDTSRVYKFYEYKK